jgi:hypothetical protein
VGFEIEEAPIEEYSFKEYILQPAILSNRIFSAIISSPRLKYWLLATIISSPFQALGSWLIMNKLLIEIRASEELPAETLQLMKSVMDLMLRNPLIIFIDSLIGELLAGIISGIVIFLVAKLLAGKGSLSSGIALAGLRSLPSIVYGILLAVLGLSLPTTRWVIEIGPQMNFNTNVPWEIFLQESVLQLIISVWFLLVLLLSYIRGYGMTRTRAAIASLVTWLVSNIFLLIGFLSYI